MVTCMSTHTGPRFRVSSEGLGWLVPVLVAWVMKKWLKPTASRFTDRRIRQRHQTAIIRTPPFARKVPVPKKSNFFIIFFFIIYFFKIYLLFIYLFIFMQTRISNSIFHLKSFLLFFYIFFQLWGIRKHHTFFPLCPSRGSNCWPLGFQAGALSIAPRRSHPPLRMYLWTICEDTSTSSGVPAC